MLIVRKNVIYKIIPFDEFRQLDCITLFHDEKTARRFGVITNGIISFKFSWQSDTIDPVMKVYNKNSFYCLGIDLMFSIIKFNENDFKSVVKVDYLLYDIRFIEGGIWVITELEILVVDVVNYTIVKKMPLPSIFQKIISESLLVTVECMGGEIITVEVP